MDALTDDREGQMSRGVALDLLRLMHSYGVLRRDALPVHSCGAATRACDSFLELDRDVDTDVSKLVRAALRRGVDCYLFSHESVAAIAALLAAALEDPAPGG